MANTIGCCTNHKITHCLKVSGGMLASIVAIAILISPLVLGIIGNYTSCFSPTISQNLFMSGILFIALPILGGMAYCCCYSKFGCVE